MPFNSSRRILEAAVVILVAQVTWSGCHLSTKYDGEEIVEENEPDADVAPDVATTPDSSVDESPPCTDLCGPDDGEHCDGSQIVACGAASSGCAEWVPIRDCADSGMTCIASSAGPICIMRCEEECSEESTRCRGHTVEICLPDEDGCLQWSPDEDCAELGLLCLEREGVAECADRCPERVYDGGWNVMVSGEEDLTALAGYTRIAGNLVIDGTRLHDLRGLGCLESIEARLLIDRNVAMTSLQGLNSLRSVGTLYIRRNPELTSLVGLSALTTIEVGGFEIADNVELPTCEAEELLERVRDPDWIGEPRISGNDDDATCD